VLFLLVAEERDLLFDDSATPRQQAIYRDHYSLARMRELADGRRVRMIATTTCGESDATFSALRDGCEPLGLKRWEAGCSRPCRVPTWPGCVDEPRLLDAVQDSHRFGQGSFSPVNYATSCGKAGQRV